MSSHEPVSQWIERIKAGDEDAATRLWDKYYGQLIRLVCYRLRGVKRREADEEDVVARALETFFRRAKGERFPELKDRDDLWHLLVTITDRKAKNFVRDQKRQKRGGGRVRGESGFIGNVKNKASRNGADQFAGDEPTPEFTVMMSEAFERLLDVLDDELREIALLKLEGYSNHEVAVRIGRSTRTVDRRIGLIRQKWNKEDEP